MFRPMFRRMPPLVPALALSLLLHAMLLWEWHPDLHMSKEAEKGEMRIPLRAQLRLEPQPAQQAPAAPRSQPQPPPARRSVPPPPAKRAAPSPPVIALNTPAPAPAQPVPAVPAPPPVVAPRAPSAQGDFSAMLDARRRERGEAPVASPAAGQSDQAREQARRDSIVASNLGQDARSLTFDPDQGGGVFQIRSLNFERAEFYFYGWNKDIRRNSSQLIEVRKGDSPDIRIAVVRRMIGIIREHEQGDFQWESHRLRRVITLSARQADNRGLEDFMLREFFSGG